MHILPCKCLFSQRCQGFVQSQWGGASEGEGVCLSGGVLQTEVPRSAGQVGILVTTCQSKTMQKIIPRLRSEKYSKYNLKLFSHILLASWFFWISFFRLHDDRSTLISHSTVPPSSRFAKLLLRLPALRSIGLKCLEHLFFFKLIGDTPIDTFLMEMLEAPHQLT